MMVWILAYRNLVHDKVRLIATLTGVVFSVILITVQFGLFLGFTKAICDIIDHTDADIWITPRGIPNYEQVVPMTEHPRYRILSVPGVHAVGAMVTLFVPWKKRSGGQQLSIIVGSDHNDNMLSLWNLSSGDIDLLRLPDTVAVDRLYQRKLEIERVGDVAEINGHRARVVALTEGIRSFTTSPFVFTSVKNSRQYAGLDEDEVTYLLVRTSAGIAPAVVRDRIKVVFPEVDVYTKREFRHKTQWNWMVDTGAGSAIVTAALMGLIVGMVVVAQTLYSSTIDHLNEYATLRAMGATNRVLYQIIVLQAVMAAIGGYVLGIGISLAIAKAAEFSMTAIRVTPELCAAMFVITLLMCVSAAVTSISKVTRIEPAMVFRG